MRKVTIITVTKNCERTIEKTIQSVFEQKFSDYEYIIIDGNSVDRTPDIIREYQNKREIVFISEADNGIYDAMNKGVSMAKGDFIFFLNSGDYFCNPEVLSRINDCIDINSEADIIYGNVKMSGRDYYNPKHLLWMQLLFLERTICHQAIFVRKYLFEKYPFDTRYKICADREWIMYQLKNGAKIQYIQDLFVVFYDGNGASSYYDVYGSENLAICEKYGGRFCRRFVIAKRRVGELIGHKRKWKNA